MDKEYKPKIIVATPMYGGMCTGEYTRSMILPDVFIDQDTPEKMYDVAGLNAKHISQKVLEVFFSKDGIRVIK